MEIDFMSASINSRAVADGALQYYLEVEHRCRHNNYFIHSEIMPRSIIRQALLRTLNYQGYIDISSNAMDGVDPEITETIDNLTEQINNILRGE
jgi:hypothetical protein